MARLFVTGIDLNKNELLNARIQNLSSAPSSPVAGQIYFNTTAGVLYFYSGTEWVPASGSTEVIQDVIDTTIVDGTGLDKVYNDGAGTVTLSIDSTVTTNDGVQTLTNKTLTSPTVSGLYLTDSITFEGSTANEYETVLQVTDPTADRTITLPNATDTLVGRATTDTLTNKTVNIDTNTGNVFQIQGNGITSYSGSGSVVILQSSPTLSSPAINSGVLLNGSTSGHTTIQASAVASGVITFPATTGTVITSADTGTVTNTMLAGSIANDKLTNSSITINSFPISLGGSATFGTDNIGEGSTNKYFTDERAQDAVGNAVGNGLDYDDTTGAISVDPSEFALNSVGTATGDVSLGGFKITSLGTPTNSTDAANKAYVDSVTEGLHIHASAVAATTANVDIATDLEAGDVLDGVTLVAGDRVLVKDQTAPSQNGIYVVQATGAALRAADFDQPAEVDGGDFIFVTGGTANNDTGWVQTSTGVTTIGTDPIYFTQFSGAGTFTAGAGLTLTGTVFSADVTPTTGNASLTNTGGAIEVKTDTTRGLSVDANGLGINAGTGLTHSAGALTFAAGYGVRKYATSVGDGSATSITVTHNFNTKDVTVHVYDNSSPYAQVEADIEHATANAITVKFAAAPTSDQYRVVVVG